MKKPNFLIIGANKAGTSSLYSYLNQHPEIFMSVNKEPMYFSLKEEMEKQTNQESEKKTLKNLSLNLESYLSLFDGVKNEKAIGEASTSYLANPTCSKTIKQFDPAMKIIAVLRNPIKRAFSNYLMYKRWGFEKRSFKKAIQDEINNNNKNVPQGMQYLKLGLYADPLSMFFETFPKTQVKVYLFDDFRNKINDILKDIYSFLEVDENFRVDSQTIHNGSDDAYYYSALTKLNSHSRLRNILEKSMPNSIIDRLKKKPVLGTEEKLLLINFFREDIQKTSTLINKNLDHWVSEK